MKRIIAILIPTLLLLSCQDKIEVKRPAYIQGSWYGIIGKNPMTGNEQEIRLDLDRGIAEISTYFARYDRGWHDAIGTYTYDGKDTIKFNIDMGECEIPNNGKTTITYATVRETASTSEVGKTEIILKLHYDRIDSYGEFSQNYSWLYRNRRN